MNGFKPKQYVGQISSGLLWLLSGAMLSSTALAEGSKHPTKFYGELGTGYSMIEADTASFNIPTLEARFGYYLQPQLGIELHALSGLGDDTTNDLSVELTSSVNLLARFETPERDGGKLFLLGGYGQTSLDIDRSGTGNPGKQNFKNGNFGAGVEFALGTERRWYVNAKWHRYYADGGVSIDVAGINLRMAF